MTEVVCCREDSGAEKQYQNKHEARPHTVEEKRKDHCEEKLDRVEENVVCLGPNDVQGIGLDCVTAEKQTKRCRYGDVVKQQCHANCRQNEVVSNENMIETKNKVKKAR